MRDDRIILEIDGERYAVDRTFSDHAAIYWCGPMVPASPGVAYLELGHSTEPRKRDYRSHADEADQVMIIARKYPRETAQSEGKR